jgi:hypothetical protein
MDKTRTSLEIRSEWVEEADEMDVSNAEYIRRMVRAGRRQWGHDHIEEPEQNGLRHTDSGSTKVEKALQAALLRNLSIENGVQEDELAELLFDDLLDDLKGQLQELKDDGQATYNPGDGGRAKIKEEG